MNYDSKRITISFPAVERLREAYNLPSDLPNQTLAGYVERLIFECLCKHPISQTVTPTETATSTENTQVSELKPNFSKLAGMIKKN